MLLTASCFLWAGMILGISFLETPIKFTAPSVTLPIGLDVGRYVFGVFNKVEISWALLSCGLMLLAGVRRTVWLPLVIAVGVVALQAAWLLPVLMRVGMILSGQTPPPASYHLIYVVLEAIKLFAWSQQERPAFGHRQVPRIQHDRGQEYETPSGTARFVGRSSSCPCAGPSSASC
jgi:hypothetical protein